MNFHWSLHSELPEETLRIYIYRQLIALGTLTTQLYKEDMAGLLYMAKAVKIRQKKTDQATRDIACELIEAIDRYRKEVRDPGFVYVLKGGEYYKVGRTKKPTRRIKTIELQIPFKVEPVIVLPTLNDRAAEKWLHDFLANSRANGEWFKIDQDTLDDIGTLPSSIFSERLEWLFSGGYESILSDMNYQVVIESQLHATKNLAPVQVWASRIMV